MRLKAWYSSFALLALLVFISTPACETDPAETPPASPTEAPAANPTETPPASPTEMPPASPAETAPASPAEAATSPAGNTHQGKVVKAGDGKLTMTDMEGQHEHSHDMAVDAVITCGGVTCALDELKAGATITVTTEKQEGKTEVTKIEMESAEEGEST